MLPACSLTARVAGIGEAAFGLTADHTTRGLTAWTTRPAPSAAATAAAWSATAAADTAAVDGAPPPASAASPATCPADAAAAAGGGGSSSPGGAKKKCAYSEPLALATAGGTGTVVDRERVFPSAQS